MARYKTSPLKPSTEDVISSYAGLVGLATLVIYAGAHASLKSIPKPKPPKKLIPDPFEEDSDTEDEDEEDLIEESDAYLYPVLGSFMLLGIYWIMRNLGAEIINELLAVLFGFGGPFTVYRVWGSFFRWLVGPVRYQEIPKYRLVFLRGPLELLSWSIPSSSIPFIFISFVPTIQYLFLTPVNGRKSPFWTGFFAVCYGFNSLSLVKLDSFRTGVIMLAGLFLYDIGWVFGSNVMVEVATNVDLPIKLLWPKSLSFATNQGYSLLGLGDVVVPGMFVALALRYDQARYMSSTPKNLISESFPKPYFISTMIAYVAGLITTMAVVHSTNKAQPALLYLSPACVLAFLLTAMIRGELKRSWEWSAKPPSRSTQPISYPDHPIAAGVGSVSTDAPSSTPPAKTDTADEDDAGSTDRDASNEGADVQKPARKKKAKKH